KEVLELPQATTGGSWLDFYAMGFDGTTSTYKIVRVFGKRSEIYTLGTSSWREISSVPPEDLDNMSNGVSAYGDMHWADDDHFSFGQRKGVDNCVIISFDFKKEEFKRTPTPDFGSLSYEHERFVMINLKGCLAIVILTPEDIEIWMMKDYDRKEWVKEYKITHNCELIIKEFCLYVGAWGPGVVLDAYCSQKLPVVVFDLKTREVLNLQVPQRVDYNRRNYSYAANILSLRHFGNIIGAEEDRRRLVGVLIDCVGSAASSLFLLEKNARAENKFVRFRNVSKFWVDPIDSVSFAIKHVTCSAEEQPQILVSPCPKLGAYTPLRSLIYDDDNGVKESDQYPNPILKLWSSCGKKSILSLRLLTVSYELKIFAMN
ncbi:hypothetical protein CICLE_v10030374mg, partial [Citrus x clementina]